MEQKLSIQGAMADASRVLRPNFVAFCASPLVIGAFSFGLFGLIGLLPPLPKGVVVLIVALPLCCILSYFVYTSVSDMYLKWRIGVQPSLRSFGQVMSYPGLGWTLFRLLMRISLWALFGIFVAALCLSALRLMVHRPSHGIPSHLRIGLCIAVIEVFCCQYSFVIPMMAFTRNGSKEMFNTAVRLARRHWLTLAVIAVAETIIVLLPNDVMLVLIKQSFATHAVSIAWKCVNVLYIAVFSAWYYIFKTALLLQAQNHDNTSSMTALPAELNAGEV